jgi:4-hydroxybenzoate polyprenyltransferase
MAVDLVNQNVGPETNSVGTNETWRAYVGRRPLRGLILLGRPWHWVKNIFVLLPLPFAIADQLQHGQLDFQILPLLTGLIGFCLINSAVYALNDVVDAQADRLHSRKKSRPVASGDVAVPFALGWGVIVMTAGIALCWLASRPHAIAVACLYVAINLAYSLGAKHVTLLDVFLVSAGFVLRVLLGCFLLDVPPSNWLLLCSSSLALFLGCAKRRADLAAGLKAEHRPSLAGYDYSFLNQMLGITATVTLMAYCLYSFNSPVFVEKRQLASVPFVAYGILHYLRISLIQGAGASPVAMFYTSRTLQLCGLGWLLAVTWSMGLWSVLFQHLGLSS